MEKTLLSGELTQRSLELSIKARLRLDFMLLLLELIYLDVKKNYYPPMTLDIVNLQAIGNRYFSIRFCLVFPMFFLSLIGIAQNISEEKFRTLLPKTRPLYTDTSTKDYYGCGEVLECMDLDLDFKSICLNKTKRELNIEVFIYLIILENGDSIGLGDFKIFLAQPYQNKLRNIRIISDVENRHIKKAVNTQIELKTSHVKTRIKFQKKDRLYILGEGHMVLKEFNIGKLLQ